MPQEPVSLMLPWPQFAGPLSVSGSVERGDLSLMQFTSHTGAQMAKRFRPAARMLPSLAELERSLEWEKGQGFQVSLVAECSPSDLLDQVLFF